MTYKNELVKEFVQELQKFLHYQNHPYRNDKVWEVDYALAEGILYNLTSSMINNCVEFVFEDGYLIVYQDCYNCGAKNCYVERLPMVLREFKKIWRSGYK